MQGAGPTHRSYSQLTSFLRCGEAYRLEKIVRVPQAPAIYLIGGSAFHEATETYDSCLWSDILPDEALEMALSAFAVTFEKRYLRSKESEPNELVWRSAGRRTKDKPDGESVEWWATAGAGMVAAYASWRQENPEYALIDLPDGSPSIEVEMMVRLGDIVVKQAADRVFVDTRTGLLLVVDLKTGAREPSSNLQLGVYRHGLEHTIGLPVDLGAYYMARTGKLTMPVPLGQFTEELLTDWFAKLDRAVKAEIFIPNIDSHCRQCGVARYCAANGGDLASQAT